MLKKSLLAISCIACIPLATAQTVEQSASVQQQINRQAAASQVKIDNLSDKQAAALQQYRSAIQRAESLEIYNAQLEKLVASQQQEMTSIKAQTEQIDQIELGVLPLMVKMVDTLEKLIDADAPFLLHERTSRVENLTQLIDRADVTVGEKYRRIMEAYNIEMEYGKTIEAYNDELVTANQPRSVDFLRIGRLGLYYQTLDGNESGRWNPQTRNWETLPGDYRRAIRDGLRVARKQAPPELLTLAINSPK
ncbi:DUF3450 domain-containing protein [Alteromonas aestuariivivens]|uniref:DUF3450 domain-containing protein n=1 Tax=Alteromonas aestuariivivens TaxID=1938339 RepID=A0A3D8MFZ7_9ALTE|nr:DUF3450 domain-containing protein [Alteromonas aestuariivivens]RDV29434.1 DUF3450 domain-containing protein [Alteromonas aestuariivivens]